MARVCDVIEMHQGEEPLDDETDYSPLPGRSGLLGLVFGAPALAIAALVIGLASLGGLRAADLVGEARFIGSNSSNSSGIVEFRSIAVVDLVAAGVALLLALMAVVRVRAPVPGLAGGEDDVDGEVPNADDPLWVRGLAGAAVIVAVVAVVAAVVALVVVGHTHPDPRNGGF
jgi:hypothetical protein